MKDGKIIGLILGGLNIVLIAVCLFFLLRMDREAPKLEFQPNDLIYTIKTDESRLLEGIKAYDSHDGDITEKIVIEKKIEKKKDNKVIVFYAVSDKSGNITKASREFNARFLDKDNDKMMNQIKEAGVDEAFNIATETVETPMGEQSEEPSVTPDAIPTPTVTPTVEPTVTPTVEPTATPVEEQENIVQEEQTHNEEPPVPQQIPGAAPVFTLKVSEVKTSVGVRPALVDVIGKLTDDKDSYETLFHNIVISKYDINKEGTYHVTLTTEDSDGNASSAQPLTIIVE